MSEIDDCEICTETAAAIEAVNAGLRPFDSSILNLIVTQQMHTLEGMCDDIDSHHGPLEFPELADRIASTLRTLAFGCVTNANTIALAGQQARERISRSN